MKKFFALLLCVLMILSAVSCSSSLAVTEEKEETKTEVTLEDTTATKEEVNTEPITLPEGFSVGWAREVISPESETGLGGYGNPTTRLSKTVSDDLMLSCTAICDGESVVLLFTADVVSIGYTLVKTTANRLNKAYGVPVENVFIGATHTHSAPPLNGSDFANSARYTRLFYVTAEKVAGKALRDLENATVFSGSGQTENLNFVRRYVYKATGTYAGGEVGDPYDPAVYAHESEADGQLQIIKFDRETKKDVVLCNWQCHPTGPGGENDTRVSADWIGSLRDTVEKEADVLFSFHQGAEGNLGQSSRLVGLPKWGNENFVSHGKEIAKTALSVMGNLSPVEVGKIQVAKTVLEAEFKPEILSGEQKRVYSNQISLSAFSAGEIAFAFCPGEPSDTVGKAVKENSPFKTTFFCGYSNGTNGYIPAEFSYANGGYEVKSTNYAKGTAEKIAETLSAELKSLYQTKS